MKAMCANKRNQISSQDVVVMTLNQGKQGPEYRREENTKKESIKKESDQQQVISKKKRKCNRVIGLGQKVLHDERRMKQGGIIKSGNSWFITEYDRGYAIFEILDNPGKIDFSDPQTIHTLSFPFTGYNHAYSHANNTIYYISEDGSFISSYNTKTQKGMGHRKINSLINRNIYYQIEGSSALHYSENHLWLIYNRDEHNHLTVSRLEPKTLKEIKTIRLNKFDRPIRNTFITCGILYAIDCEGYKCRVLPIFDLIRNKYVMKKENFLLRGGNHWTSYGNITSLTYDSISRKLGVLDDGKIYSVQVNIE
uniref:Olfactomedin-like domain-containing protein n=1 Tax=Rhabditophanes sp. KR3021 TaxID=114890 RepID=A0AC35U8S6_9BILA